MSDMSRYACPPWYECRCVRGRIVSFGTMWNHRKAANRRRRALGRGIFKNGPKVSKGSNEFNFANNETLIEHETDDEYESSNRFGHFRAPNGKQQLLSNDELPIPQPKDLKLALENSINNVETNKGSIEGVQSPAHSTAPLVQKENTNSHQPTEQGTTNNTNFVRSSQIQMVDSCMYSLQEQTSLTEMPNFLQGSNYQEAVMIPTPNFETSLSGLYLPEHFPNLNTGHLTSIEHTATGNEMQPHQQSVLSQQPSTPNSQRQWDNQFSISSYDQGQSSYEISPESNGEITSNASEDSEPEHACRIPGMWNWIVENRELIDIYFKHGLEYTVMDDLLRYLQAPCKRWVAVVDAIHRYSGLKNKLVKTATCPGHMAFVDWNTCDRYQDHCLQCNSSRPPSVEEAMGYFTYIPLVPRIRAMVADEGTCKGLYAYRQEECFSSDIITDVFHGTAYKNICDQYGGDDEVKYDVFIGASMDGFQVFKKTDHEVWSIAALNLNLPPHERYLPRNILPLCFLPGPNQPKNMQSYLVPFIKELQHTSENGGIRMRFYDGIERKVRIHLLYFSGDQPAVSKAAGLAGHNGRHPCRNCNIRGQHLGHYYYPSKMVGMSNGEIRIDHFFSPRDLPLRSEAQSRAAVLDIEGLTGSQKAARQKDSGIMERSLICFLPTMHEYNSFVHAIMHTFMNITKELLRIMISSGIQDGFSLLPCQVESLDKEIVSWRRDICSQISDPPPPLSKYNRWKAAECKTFALSFMLVIFDGTLDEIYLNGLSKFSIIVDIASRPVLTKSDITELRFACIDFFEHYEREYFKYDQSRINLCKSIFHVLLHLADCTEYMGPLCGVSQFWMERYVGWVGDRLNARQLPAESMIKSCIYYESFKIAFNVPVHSNSTDYDTVEASGSYILLGPSRFSTLNGESQVGRSRIRLLRIYLRRKYTNISAGQVGQIVDRITKIELYSRVQFIVGSDVVTSGVYFKIDSDQLRKPNQRADYYVAVEMDHREAGCDVYYGRILELMEFYIPSGILDEVEEHGSHHRVAILDWGKRLKVGDQGQIYKVGTTSQVFTGATMEDIEGIARLISVVQHKVPWSSREGAQTRSYFVDECSRLDHLLTNRKSYDGYNRKLLDLDI